MQITFCERDYMEHVERIEKLEGEVRRTQDNVLLIHRDLQQMSKSMEKMATAMEAMAKLQTDMKVFEERMESRHNEDKDQHKYMNNRINTLEERVDAVEPMAEKGSFTHSVLLWTAKGLGSLVLAMLFGLMIWAIQASKYQPH